MHKLRFFQRSQKSKTEQNKRSQQFVKRHSAIATSTLRRSTSLATTPARSHKPQETSNENYVDVELTTPPFIDGAELSASEQATYGAWWSELDPFDFGKVNIQTLEEFLHGCKLPDSKLDQILTLFGTSCIRRQGMDKLQFFALLRLVAHAQSGSKISRALVYVEAPITQWCGENTLNPCFVEHDPKRNSNQEVLNISYSNHDFDIFIKGSKDILDVIPNNTTVSQCELHQQQERRPKNRQSWWGSTDFIHSNGRINDHSRPPLQQNGSRRSYNGPFTINNTIPRSTHRSVSLSEKNTTINISSTKSTTSNSASTFTSTDTGVALNNSSNVQMLDYFDTFALSRNSPTSTFQKQEALSWIQPNTHYVTTNDISLSLQPTVEEGNGSSVEQRLLLTQEFVYESPSLQRKTNKNNPFQIDTTLTSNSNVIPASEEELKSPFDDENNVLSATVTTTANSKPNSYLIPPPPVPSQATKPAFPKYARRTTNNVNMRRTQSTKESTNSTSYMSSHQKHKSASNAFDIFTFSADSQNNRTVSNRSTVIF